MLGDKIPNTIHGLNGVVTCYSRAFTTPFIDWWPRRVQKWYWEGVVIPRLSRTFAEHHPQTAWLNERVVALSPGERTEFYLDREMARSHLFREYTRQSETAMIDDGLLQFYLFLLEEGVSKDEIVAYVPMPDVLIAFETDPAVCLDRQEQRNRGRASAFVGLEREEAIDRLAAMNEATTQLARAVESTGCVVIRPRPDDDTDAETVCENIVVSISKQSIGVSGEDQKSN